MRHLRRRLACGVTIWICIGAILSAQQRTNIDSIAGTAVSAGSGVNGSGVLRVNEATDSTLTVSMQAVETATESLVSALYSDPLFNDTLGGRGPQIMCEASDVDGAALLNQATEEKATRPKCSLAGILYSTLVHEDGLSSPIGNEDVASAGAEAGIKVFAIRDDTLDVRSGTEGDFEYFHTNANGALWTIDVNSAALLTSNQLQDDVVGVEDVAETADRGLSMIGAVRRDTAASSAGTSGDNATVNVDGLGRLWTRAGGPCEDHARVSSAAINTAASGNVEIVALNGSDLIYICAVDVVVDAAVDIQLIYGTGTACATGETDLTGIWGFAANGGIAKNKGVGPYFVVPAGNAFCIETSGAVQTSGSVTYVRTAAP